MKRNILIIVVFLAIIAAALFGYQNKINSEINSKIEEFNNKAELSLEEAPLSIAA